MDHDLGPLEPTAERRRPEVVDDVDPGSWAPVKARDGETGSGGELISQRTADVPGGTGDEDSKGHPNSVASITRQPAKSFRVGPAGLEPATERL